jgi:hypothetical protein
VSGVESGFSKEVILQPEGNNRESREMRIDPHGVSRCSPDLTKRKSGIASK